METTDLIRMGSAVNLRTDGDNDGRTLVGFGAVFNEWTTIDSLWEGKFKERIAPGAFEKTISERGDQIKAQFNHGMDPAFGTMPIGKPSLLEEREKGLWIEVPLFRSARNDELLESVRVGAIDGMSIRMNVMRDDEHVPDEGLKERTLTEIRLLETGPVVWPAYDGTTTGIRMQDFETWQRLDDEQRYAIEQIIRTGQIPAPDEPTLVPDPAANPDPTPPATWDRLSRARRLVSMNFTLEAR